MPRQRQYHCLNRPHYFTASTYRRARVFDSERFRRHFVKTLSQLRESMGFKIIGYVLMPEHFHLLIWPCGLANPSQVVQSLKERTAIFILKTLRQNPQHVWCRKMLARLALPATVHYHGPSRVWQRRFYDLNVWSEKKRREKITYMHNNPVKRRLVSSPDLWPWSSFRFYYLEDSSLLAMNRLP